MTRTKLSGERGVIANTIEIAATPQVVFDYCTDTRNETAWNSKLIEVVKRTDGAVGRGTRMATATSRRLDVRFEGEVAGTVRGSRLTVRTLLLPHGALRVALPMLRTIMRRHWNDNLRNIRTRLESDVAVAASLHGRRRTRRDG